MVRNNYIRSSSLKTELSITRDKTLPDIDTVEVLFFRSSVLSQGMLMPDAEFGISGTALSGEHMFRFTATEPEMFIVVNGAKRGDRLPTDYYIQGFSLREGTIRTLDCRRSNLQYADRGRYRFGFNGQEFEPQVSPGAYSAEFWMYESRLGRRWNLDPRPNVSISPYATFANNPVLYPDFRGDSISTTFYDESGNETNVIPDQLQKEFNNEYGIELGYNAETKMLYQSGTVNPQGSVSENAFKYWSAELGEGTSEGKLVFGYQMGITVENSNSIKDVNYGIAANTHKTAYIDLGDFDGNVPIGTDFQYKVNHIDKWSRGGRPGTEQVNSRNFSLARVMEHEFIGHALLGLTDYGLNAGPAGKVESIVGNPIRMQLGLPVRMNYDGTFLQYGKHTTIGKDFTGKVSRPGVSIDMKVLQQEIKKLITIK